jgi:hypothetical protein
VTAALLYLNTAPWGDCGEPIDHLRHPWYPLYPDGQLCHRCGPARGLTGAIPAGSC